MDFNDKFRSFFGLRGPQDLGHTEDDSDSEHPDFSNTPPALGLGVGSFGSHGHAHEGGDGDVDDDATFGRGHHSGAIRPFGGDLFFKFEEETQNTFRHFEDMFRNFGLADGIHPEKIDGDALPLTPSSEHQSPRDEMLKHPDSFPQPQAPTTPPPPKPKPNHEEADGEREPVRKRSHSWSSVWNPKSKWHFPVPFPHRADQDLDDHVRKGKLDEILGQREPTPPARRSSMQSSTTPRSYFKSISVHTVRKADGTVEQRRTETDSEGNVTSTVTSTNPRESGSPSLMPGLRAPDCQQPAPLKDEETTVGQATTDSIYDRLFGSWGKR